MWYGVYYYFNKGQIDNKDMFIIVILLFSFPFRHSYIMKQMTMRR